jgi:hypothetical protein
MHHLLAAIILILTAVISVSVDAAPVKNTDSKYNTFLNCGPNSLYVFLVMCGKEDVTLSQMNKITLSDEGASMLSLKKAALMFNIDTVIKKYPITAIDDVPVPALVQLVGSQDSATPYHFGVFYMVDSRSVYILDGTTGGKLIILRRRLGEFWTGVAMSRKRSAILSLYSILLLKPWYSCALISCVTIAASIGFVRLLRFSKCGENKKRCSKT